MKYSVPYQLPFGVTIIQKHTKDDYYEILASRVNCFGFTLENEHSIKIVGQHVTFYENQQNTIRVWPSIEPNGGNLNSIPYSNMQSIKIGGQGFIWNFYDISHPEYQLAGDVNLNVPISPNTPYYMNVQNLENKTNHFYLKFISLERKTACSLDAR
jgi:hypothetical protein